MTFLLPLSGTSENVQEGFYGGQGLGGAVTDIPVKTGCRVDRWACLSFVPRGWWRPAGQSLPGSLVSKVKITAGERGTCSQPGMTLRLMVALTHPQLLLSRVLASRGHLQPESTKWKIPEANSS